MAKENPKKNQNFHSKLPKTRSHHISLQKKAPQFPQTQFTIMNQVNMKSSIRDVSTNSP
jgi:hypothetical protein